MGEITKGGPLKGLKVIDLTRVLSGPYCTKWLATMGADVIKVEDPKNPDVTRTYYPDENGNTAYFPTFNHNKRCITLNLKAEEGKEILRRLVKDADVLVENFRPNVMDKLGIGYEELSKLNPGLVYASISGYGTYGPYADRPGYDITAQAISGLMYLTGQEDGVPTRAGSSFGDTSAGESACLAILAALYCRNMTGHGQKVETSLVDSLITLSAQDYVRYFGNGDIPKRMGNNYKSWHPYGSFKAMDGYYNIGVGTPGHWVNFCRCIDREDLIDHPDYHNHDVRVAHRQELNEIIDAWAGDKTVKYICDRLVAFVVPCGPVNSIVEVSQDEHIAGAREMFPVLHQTGYKDLHITNIPVRFSKSGLAELTPSGKVGENNEDVLEELGYSVQEMKALKEKGII